jgi:hypothetical protein
MSITAKISRPTHKALKHLSKQTGKSMQLVLDEAVELYRRQNFFDELNSQALASKSDPNAWAEELEERTLSEYTLSDGLDDNS